MKYIVTIQYPNYKPVKIDVTRNLTSSSWESLKLSFSSEISGYTSEKLHNTIEYILIKKGIVSKDAKILALEIE